MIISVSTIKSIINILIKVSYITLNDQRIEKFDQKQLYIKIGRSVIVFTKDIKFEVVDIQVCLQILLQKYHFLDSFF